MATYTGTSGQNDTFPGTSGADTFNFEVPDLNGSDTVTGGAGVDTLSLTGTGALGPAQLAGVSGIDVVTLVNGGISIAIDDAVATANGNQITVNGSAGDDVFDASAVTLATRTIAVNAGAGNDTFRGGAGNDIFRFDAANLTSADTVSGGGGTVDQLFISTAGTVTAANLAGVSGIERVLLANGTNSITLTNAMAQSATGNLIQVFGGTGDDTINATAITGGGRVDITAYSGLDMLSGSAGNDTFRFVAAELSGDTVAGGPGSDTIAITGADAITTSDLAKVSGIEQFTFAVGGVSITLNDAVASANGGTIGFFGSSGDDVVDASAVTLASRAITFAAGAGNDTVRGGAGNDVFKFATADLTSADIVSGGSGSSVDQLAFTTAGTVSAAAFQNESGIERFTLTAGTNSLTFTDALVTSANGGAVTIFASSGNDTIDLSAVTTASTRVDIYAGGGVDTIIGGAGNDTVRLNADALTAADTFNGGGGVDALYISSGGSVSAAALAGVSNFEAITLGQAGATITINDAVAAANAAVLTVYGTVGNDTINASSVTNTTRSLSITAGQGNDSFSGGAGADVFRFNADDLDAGDLVSGGSGASVDTLSLTAAGTITAADLARVSGIEQVVLAATGGVSIALSNAMVSSATGGRINFIGSAGNDTVDASAVTTATNRIDVNAGAGIDTLTGGAGDDIFRFGAINLTAADTVTGGGGNDTLLLTSAGSTVIGANIAGIETVSLGAGGIGVTLANGFLANNPGVVFNGSAGNDTVDASAVVNATGITVFAGAGNDTLKGVNNANDFFYFDAANLTSADTVQGGTGYDYLLLSAPGAIAAAAFANVTGIEQINLSVANGTNNIALSNALVTSAGGAILVTGGSGNDTIDASAVTSASNAVTFSASAGVDTFVGGAGNDVFAIAPSDLTSADTFQGGGGTDTLQFQASGTVAAANLAGISGIEAVALSSGGNSIAFNDTFASANAAVLAVTGGAGNDTVDGSAVTLTTRAIDVTAGAGNDTLRGGAGNDTFRFAAGDLDGADTVNGGAGTDVLQFTAAGTIAASQLVGTSNLEQITLGGVGSSIAFNNAAVANNASTLAVVATSGNDTVDASAVTNAARGISVQAGAGNDTLRGGAGADTFQFSVANLTAADTVQGGAGSAIDTLLLNSAGNVTAAALAGVSGLERIALANGTNSIVLSAALVASADAQTLRVLGGSGNDTVNGAAAAAGSKLDITAGGGDDLLIGGAGADTFRFAVSAFNAADTVSGGDGSDTLALTGAGTIDFTVADNVASVETIQLDNNAHTVVLSDAVVQAADGKTLTVAGGTGADTIDVSRVTSGDAMVVVNSGDGDDVLIDSGYPSGSGPTNLGGDLGAGNDRVEGTTYFDPITLAGGSGTDTISLDTANYGFGTYLMSAGVTGFEIVELKNSSGAQGYTASIVANDTVGLTVNGVTAGNYYNIKLGNGGQSATGNNLVDSLVGGIGADTITGAAGNDTIDGGGGADVIDAGGDNDAIRYRTGATSIAGGLGIDTLYALDGGTFDLSAADQSLGDAVNVTGFENFDGYSFSTFVSGENSTAGATVTGTSGINALGGTDYNDVLDGNGGADTIIGRGGADRITYRGSEAAIHAYYEGGYGDVGQGDTLVLRTAVTIRLANTDQTSSDAVNVSAFQNVDGSAVATALNMQGDSYDNILIGGSANDTISGLDGGDTIDGGAGADTLNGGNGNDRIWYDGADTSVAAGADTDTLLLRGAGNINLAAGDQGIGDTGTMTGFENADASASTAAVTLRGRNDFVSTLVGGSAGDVVAAGNAGADITGGAGADTLTGSANNDSFHYSSGDVVAGETLNAGGGSDVAYVRGNVDFTGSTITGLETIQINTYDPITGNYGTEPNNIALTGTQAAALASIEANPIGVAADTFTINVATGTTVSLANTTYNYFESQDQVLVNGAAGNETITGPNFRATIHGLGGNDTLKAPGSAGSAYWADGTAVYGDAGNDRIDYGYVYGTATLDGGADSDTLVASYNYVNPTTIDLALTDQTTGDNMSVANFENVDWSNSNNAGYGVTIYGSSAVNTLIGTGFADIIDGRGGADVINAGAGDDVVTYDAADTSILGGADIDRLIVTGAANINLAAADQGIGDTGTMTGFENVDASTSTTSVTLRGRNDYASTLLGGSGADTITAGTAGASITGGAGADTLTGSTSDDSFYFKAGDVVAGETINGAAGANDTLFLSGSNDFSVATMTGIEGLRIDTYDPASGTYGTQPVNVTLTGAQASALTTIYANPSVLDTIDTVTVNVASGTTADLSNTSFAYFNAEDSILVNGAAGNETITGPHFAATIHGNAGNDTLIAPGQYWQEGTSVFGDAGNDRIDLGYVGYAVTLDGGADSDTLVGSYGSYDYSTIAINLSLADQVSGDAGTATNFENVDFTALNYGLSITGSSGVNSLTGTAGSDVIDGASGADTIDGGNGNDFVVYDAADTLVKGGADLDWLVVKGAANINLSAADQGVGDTGTINGFENVDGRGSSVAFTARGSADFVSSLIGGSAGDTLSAGAAGANFFAGAGADTQTGSTAIDNFYLYAGDFVAGETINGNGGGDSLWIGADTNLTLGTVSGISILNLSAGSYVLEANGYVTVSGQEASVTTTITGAQAAGLGTVNASYYYSNTAETLNVVLTAGVSTDLSALAVNYFNDSDQFNVVGSAGNDTYTHTGYYVGGTIHGNGGADTLRGDWYSASVFGDAGNDSINYSANAISIDGGTETDTLLIRPYDNIVVDLNNAADQTGNDNTIVTGFENVDASASYYSQDISGNSGANVIIGSLYSDTLYGGAGADTFGFIGRGSSDLIVDFSSADDTLQFAASQFDFNGSSFNVAVNDTTGTANIAAADLIRYTGGFLDSTSDVATYLQTNGTGVADGAFIVGQSSQGYTLLFHVTDATGGNGDIVQVADLNQISPPALQLSDFLFA